MSNQNPLIRSASLSGYSELAHALGLHPNTLMRRVGLDPRHLDDPETPIRVSVARQLLDVSAREAGIEDFGLRLAMNRRISNLGPISIVLREAPTARHALDTLCRYLRLLNASLLTRVEDHADVVIIREELLDARGESVRQSMELAVGVMFRILSELLGPHWRPRLVCFAHRAPRDTSNHATLFEAPLEFNASFNGVVCAAKDLAVGLPTIDTGMAPFARRFLDQALSQAGASMVANARQLIAALLPGGRCTADQVAQHLGVDRRTLHRHLIAEGLSFSGLMQTVRREFAERQIRDSDRSLAELADLLGFSGSSAFAFWFRRAFGTTVSAWRKAHGG